MDEVARWEELVLVGRLARTHGLRGHLFVNPETDFIDERFAPGSRLQLVREGIVQTVVVAELRMQGRRPVVRFEGIERIDDAEPLTGCELRVPETALQPLAPGEVYEYQLVGCTVETVSGDAVGHVRRVEGGTGSIRLVVDGPRGEVLVPFAQAICRVVDVAAKRVVIDPPVGLLDLNETRGTPR